MNAVRIIKRRLLFGFGLGSDIRPPDKRLENLAPSDAGSRVGEILIPFPFDDMLRSEIDLDALARCGWIGKFCPCRHLRQVHGPFPITSGTSLAFRILSCSPRLRWPPMMSTFGTNRLEALTE